jgi:hypothetical protein
MKQLRQHLEVINLGLINFLLGVHIVRDQERGTVSLGQQAYIKEVIACMSLQDARPIVAPFEPGTDLNYESPSLSPTLLTPSEKSLYAIGIGLLMYLCIATRPNLIYYVTTLSQFLQEPHTTHLAALKRVFRYVKGTANLRLVLGNHTFDNALISFSNFNWATLVHRHSISGYTFFVGSGAVLWGSKKQPIVTLSSTEAEYVALTHAAKELIWLRSLINKLFPEHAGDTTLTTLHCDNQGAIALSKDSVFHAHTKHIDVRFHFIQQTIDSGTLVLEYCPMDGMVADAFTKPLARVKLLRFATFLGLEHCSA